MLECWNEEPKVRPSFSVLRERFDAMISDNEGYIIFDEINEESVYYTMPSFHSQGEENTLETSEEDEDRITSKF